MNECIFSLFVIKLIHKFTDCMNIYPTTTHVNICCVFFTRSYLYNHRL